MSSSSNNMPESSNVNLSVSSTAGKPLIVETQATSVSNSIKNAPINVPTGANAYLESISTQGSQLNYENFTM